MARLVPWIAFGAGLPATALVTLGFILGFRAGYAHYVLWLLTGTFIPTLILCLALMRPARNTAAHDPHIGERDRGVFPIATALAVYSLGGYLVAYPQPFHGGLFSLLALLVGMVVHAVLPTSLAQHVIAVAVACAVLRAWFRYTEQAGCFPTNDDC